MPSAKLSIISIQNQLKLSIIADQSPLGPIACHKRNTVLSVTINWFSIGSSYGVSRISGTQKTAERQKRRKSGYESANKNRE